MYDFADNRNTVTQSNGTTAPAQRYGNLTKTSEYDETGARVRSTVYNYAVRDNFVDDPSGAANRDPKLGAPFIADRVWVETVLNGADQYLARTFHLYDNATVQAGIDFNGARTRTSKIISIPLVTALSNTTLASIDTTTTYDRYGNPVNVTTYAGSGTATIGTNSWTFSAPGNGSAASTTTTTYDDVYHVYPTVVQPPPNLAGERLTERATYNGGMGTLTSVTDYNGHVTTATYDAFGRLHKILKPGDSTDGPTVQAYYYDMERPFRYLVATADGGDRGGNRPTVRLYDGLGREIQTKQESVEYAQHIVTDKVYDGLGNVVQQSQPRHVDQTGAAFWSYTPHAATAEMRWTTTSYDALNRPRVITRPDATREEHVYDLIGGLRRHQLVDANRHRTEWRSDALGRLREVREWAGDCNAWQYTCTAPYTTQWAEAGTTVYGYSPLDLLSQVTDAQGNRSTMTYDSLGRKLTHRDPDMGTWSYEYDVDGNLTTQTDARGYQVTFAYDALR